MIGQDIEGVVRLYFRVGSLDKKNCWTSCYPNNWGRLGSKGVSYRAVESTNDSEEAFRACDFIWEEKDVWVFHGGE
jgi:hypothetical protein